MPRDCHHMHSWQTDGAVSSVAPVSPATRGGMPAGDRSGADSPCHDDVDPGGPSATTAIRAR